MSEATTDPAVDDTAATTHAATTDAVDDDRLEALRQELEQLDRVPVSERVERFERANDVLARELAALDEV